MAKVEQSVEVRAPVRTVYNQWTQFREFPNFMEGVEEVQQLDDTHLHWVAEIAGQRREWDAEIQEQTPDQRISWMSTDGARNGGVVRFEPAADGMTRVNLELEYDPESFIEKAGDALGLVESRVKGDLQRFKTFIESEGMETGAWRGEVHGGQTVDDPADRTVMQTGTTPTQRSA
jgi:uncharacterized membrane protein